MCMSNVLPWPMPPVGPVLHTPGVLPRGPMQRHAGSGKGQGQG